MLTMNDSTESNVTIVQSASAHPVQASANRSGFAYLPYLSLAEFVSMVLHTTAAVLMTHLAYL